MATLKKLFPFSFGAKDISQLLMKIVIHVIVSAIIGLLASLFRSIFIIGIIFHIVSYIVGLYCLIGIVIAILDYTKVFP